MSKKAQIENGYTKLANELLEALICAGLTSRQWSVVMAIVRKTYGFNKKEDDIGLSQIAEMTGIAKSHVSVAVRELEVMKIITRKQGNFGHVLAINPHFETWGEVTKSVTGNASSTVQASVTESVTPDEGGGVTETVTIGVTESVTPPVTESVTTKENPSKDKHQKKERGARATRSKCVLNTYLENCKQVGVKPIPESHAVFKYADETGIPEDYLRLVWVEFKRKYSKSRKQYTNWDDHFENAVRENWYGVWFEKDGHWMLTTRGKQIQKELKEAK